MKKQFVVLLTLLLIVTSACKKELNNGRQVLLILNSNNPESIKSRQYLMPYMAHFDIPFDTLDLAREKLPKNLETYSLIIISHKNIAQNDGVLAKTLKISLSGVAKEGSGLLSFDPGLFTNMPNDAEISFADTLLFTSDSNYITAFHFSPFKLKLFDSLAFPVYENIQGNVLISIKGKPFLWTEPLRNGHIVHWASNDWMDTQVLGPLGGLDDCLWRSMVWAARKPFVIRGLPPIITMRVDDVAGRGELWQNTPLYWVETANKYGLKPWLGLFIYNLNPSAIKELRTYIENGQATASPHAFGRPPGRGTQDPTLQKYFKEIKHDFTDFYYYPKAIPLREKEYDEFIFFDHQHYKPWSNEEAKKGLDAVDKWYDENKPLPKSNYFLAHWYEAGANVIEHVSKNWGMNFIAQNKAIDMPWNDSVPWVMQGPFRYFEKPGTSTNNASRTLRGNNPLYYADFTNINGFRFFNCFTEIRDDAGYEWAPDNDVNASAGRGIRQLSRALGSMAMAVLFTHETDFIYLIEPSKWEQEIKLITEGMKIYNPLYLTTDDALKIVRATKTSKLSKIENNIQKNELKVFLSGHSDVKSYYYIFTETNGKINQQLNEIPIFDKQIEIVSKLSN